MYILDLLWTSYICIIHPIWICKVFTEYKGSFYLQSKNMDFVTYSTSSNQNIYIYLFIVFQITLTNLYFSRCLKPLNYFLKMLNIHIIIYNFNFNKASFTFKLPLLLISNNLKGFILQITWHIIFPWMYLQIQAMPFYCTTCLYCVYFLYSRNW